MTPISILLADDNPTFRQIAAEFLRQYDDLNVVGTASGGEAALLQALQLQPQVVLVDLSMPDLPGLEVIPRLRQIMPGVGIVVLTMFDSDSYREAALAAGADDFVSKLGMEEGLLPTIRRVAGRALASGRIV